MSRDSGVMAAAREGEKQDEERWGWATDPRFVIVNKGAMVMVESWEHHLLSDFLSFGWLA